VHGWGEVTMLELPSKPRSRSHVSALQAVSFFGIDAAMYSLLLLFAVDPLCAEYGPASKILFNCPNQIPCFWSTFAMVFMVLLTAGVPVPLGRRTPCAGTRSGSGGRPAADGSRW
jgi:hypothetical protein